MTANVTFFPTAHTLFANAKKFARLDGGRRAALRAAAAETLEHAREPRQRRTRSCARSVATAAALRRRPAPSGPRSNGPLGLFLRGSIAILRRASSSSASVSSGIRCPRAVTRRSARVRHRPALTTAAGGLRELSCRLQVDSRGEGSTERLDPILQTAQAAPARELGAADAVVGDHDLQLRAGRGGRDEDARRAGVLCDVRECLGAQEVRRNFDLF